MLPTIQRRNAMRSRVLCATLLLCLVSLTQAQAQSLPTAKPEAVGLSSERLARVMAFVKNDVDKGVVPGAVLLVARHGKGVLFDPLGGLDPRTKGPLTQDPIFPIYSS